MTLADSAKCPSCQGTLSHYPDCRLELEELVKLYEKMLRAAGVRDSLLESTRRQVAVQFQRPNILDGLGR